MKVNALKPCPFCGRDVDSRSLFISEVILTGETSYYVCCPRCAAAGPVTVGASALAIKLWNKRSKKNARSGS